MSSQTRSAFVYIGRVHRPRKQIPCATVYEELLGVLQRIHKRSVDLGPIQDLRTRSYVKSAAPSILWGEARLATWSRLGDCSLSSIIDIIITHTHDVYTNRRHLSLLVCLKNNNGQSFAVIDFLLVCLAGNPGNRFGGGCPTVPNSSPVAPLSLSDMIINAVLKSGVPSCQERPNCP